MSMLHKIALTFIKSIGPVTAKNLLAYCGNAENVFSASKKQLLQIPGIGEKTIEAIRGSDALTRARQELDFVENCRFVPAQRSLAGYANSLARVSRSHEYTGYGV